MDPRQQCLAIAAALEFRSHAQAHLADQTVGKTGPRGLTGLRKEFPAIGRDQKQETLGRSCRRAHVPIIGNRQRVIVDVLRTYTLHRSNHELQTRALLQVFKDDLQSRLCLGIQGFGKVVNMPARLRQPLDLGPRNRATPEHRNDRENHRQGDRPLIKER